MLTFLLINSTYAHTVTAAEKTKAAYIYHFIHFVNWPEANRNSISDRINICIYSHNNRFYHAFRTLAGKQVRNQKIIVTRLSQLKQIHQCQLLYIDQSQQSHFAEFFSIAHQLPILSVSNSGTFCNQGGMICLTQSEQHMRVEINLKAAIAAGFKISSNLLEVATIVSSQ